MAGGKPKKRLGATPKASTGKQFVAPPTGKLPGSANSHERVCWRFTHVDHDGRWGFGQVSPETFSSIMSKLKEFESMTVMELIQSRKAYQEYILPSKLIPEALRRLHDLGFGYMEKIGRFELSGKERLYGFMEGNVFHVLWWDPEHEIYEYKLKHT